MTRLSVIVPAYNEVAAVHAGKLTDIRTWMAAQGLDGELIVVDDGSADGTAGAARAAADRVIEIAHSGKAAAIATGIQQARGQVVLFTDMDQAAPIDQASRLLAALQGGSDIAIGSRGHARHGAPLGRRALSRGHSALRAALLRLPLSDTQCGLKAASRAAAVDVLSGLRRYHPERMGPVAGPSVTSGFDVEFLLVARRRGYRIAEVPVRWDYQRSRRVALLRDAWRGAGDLARIFLHDLAGHYRPGPR